MKRIPVSKAILPALYITGDKAAKPAVNFYCKLFPWNIKMMARPANVETTPALDI